MKEIVVISGKGGTGKTSLAAALAYLGGDSVVVGDCDVDAADMHLLLQPDFRQSTDFYSGELAVIDHDACIQCGDCGEVCRFDAILQHDETFTVDALACEGCAYCARICPVAAITMETQKVGQWYVSSTKANNSMVHARLGIGAENSGKLVAQVKREAKDLADNGQKDYVLIDGSPGIGCPVISSLTGADFVVLVTEATASGLHDLKRVYQVVQRFQLQAGCIINKADINPQMAGKIKAFLQEETIPLLAEIPYNEDFTKAMTAGKTVMEWDTPLRKTVEEIWSTIQQTT